MNFIEKGWYQRWSINYVLAPLSLLFWLISSLRKQLFKYSILTAVKHEVPVIVVGNISVGGTGKTPFVLYLTRLLQQLGYKPGIVSRGYGASESAEHPFPRLINELPVKLAGDEPKLLANRGRVPVVIDPNRNQAIEYLEQHCDVDIIISDDGLQHYKMARDVEITIVDKNRQFGNGWLIPVGPLRELPSRLQSVDIVVENAGIVNDDQDAAHYQLKVGNIYALKDEAESVVDREFHLVSGIGNPQRFVTTAESEGITVLSRHFFPDHHKFVAEDFSQFQASDKILITEKDAVKCQHLQISAQVYVLPIEALISADIERLLINKIQKVTRNSQHGI